MKNEFSGHPSVNIISNGTIIKGKLNTKTDLRISGTIDGTVDAESKCIVAESGLIKGDLKAKEADIAGSIEGELHIANKLVLRSSSRITGDISTKIIMVEEGAKIDGAFRMGNGKEATGSVKTPVAKDVSKSAEKEQVKEKIKEK